VAEDTQGHLQEEEHPCSGIIAFPSITLNQENDFRIFNHRKDFSGAGIPVLILTRKLRFPTIPKT
jgi:hypothetical protein